MGVQSGYLIEKPDSTPILIDCGSGVVHRIGQTRVSVLDIDTVLLTHLHPDHVSDIIAFVQARRLQDESSLEVFGPPGTDEVVKELLDAVDLWGRTSIETEILEENCRRVINDYLVENLTTKHSSTCYAYKIDEKLVYTGDTEGFEELKSFMEGVDVVIHDASYPEGFEMKNHPTPDEIGRMVENLKADMLILSHFYPQAREAVDSTIEYLRENFSGIIKPASDLDTLTF